MTKECDGAANKAGMNVLTSLYDIWLIAHAVESGYCRMGGRDFSRRWVLWTVFGVLYAQAWCSSMLAMWVNDRQW
jgi:hypothetical protein